MDQGGTQVNQGNGAKNTRYIHLTQAPVGADYANYQVILQTFEGREILRRRAGKVRFGKDRAFATLPVKARELNLGDYILILFGQTSDGRSEEIDRYFFRVS